MEKKNEEGQALIELIIFLPIMFTLYTLISGFANAINGSINQQKVTRAYFYYKIQNNSTVPKPDSDAFRSWGLFGMQFTGWKDYFQGGSGEEGRPVAPCYRVTVPLQAAAGDVCENKYSTPNTQFVRVATVYGICGATYQRIDSFVVPVPDYSGMDFSTLTKMAGCVITQ